MTAAEFKRKWARYSGKETSAYQEHFNDLCALLGQPSPAAVAAAYGFPVDLTDKQILERLLALNQQRIVDEKSATKKQPRVSRANADEEFV